MQERNHRAPVYPIRSSDWPRRHRGTEAQRREGIEWNSANAQAAIFAQRRQSASIDRPRWFGRGTARRARQTFLARHRPFTDRARRLRWCGVRELAPAPLSRGLPRRPCAARGSSTPGQARAANSGGKPPHSTQEPSRRSRRILSVVPSVPPCLCGHSGGFCNRAAPASV